MKGDKKAIISIVLSVIAFVMCWAYIGIPISIAAFILALLAMKNKESKKGLNITALVLSIVIFLAAVIMAIAISGSSPDGSTGKNETAISNESVTKESIREGTNEAVIENSTETIEADNERGTSEEITKTAQETTKAVQETTKATQETTKAHAEVSREPLSGFCYECFEQGIEMYANIFMSDGIATLEGWAYVDGKEYTDLDVKTTLYLGDDGWYTSEDGMYSIYDSYNYITVLSNYDDELLFEGVFYTYSGRPMNNNAGYLYTNEFFEFIRDEANIGCTATFYARYSGVSFGRHVMYLNDGNTSVTITVPVEEGDYTFLRGDDIIITAEFAGINNNSGNAKFINAYMERQQ